MDILLETPEFIVVSKPAGLSSVPGSSRDSCALTTLSAETGLKLFVVHRLDKGVSGALVFAKTPAAHRTLNLLFQNRRVEKLYLAVLRGIPPYESGVISAPLRQFGSGRTGVDLQRGKPCRTEYEVLGACSGLSLVRVRLITGRRHQIRVHFYSQDCPVAGDLRYGDKAAQSAFPRLLLHSWSIGFAWNGADIKISAPPPVEFIEAVRAAGLEKYLPQS